MRRNYLSYFWVIVFVFFVEPASACDPCALYNASRLQGHATDTFTLSVSEQYTDFDRAQDSKENSVKDGEFVRGFSTTQFGLAYDATERIGVQLTLPLVARKFDEIKQFRSSTESDAGLGDISLAGTYSFIDYKDQDWAVIAGFTGGVKFPTGDTGVLEDVSEEEETSDHLTEQLVLKHHQIGTATGGRALTFGTGSYDYILGLNLLSRYQRYLLLSSAQHTLRTEGDFNYEFADDFLVSLGTGYYFLLDHEFTAAGLISLSGEFKGKDHLNGEIVNGSEVSNLYLGPEFLFSLNDKLGAQVSLDFRVTDEDGDSTVVPETRIRASVSYRFS